ncbi:hypothetical protein CHU98_g8671 [Xylaria longipes]|nr:hypothetical protein CHU98_g8671 [Xylaria longipes]
MRLCGGTSLPSWSHKADDTVSRFGKLGEFVTSHSRVDLRLGITVTSTTTDASLASLLPPRPSHNERARGTLLGFQLESYTTQTLDTSSPLSGINLCRDAHGIGLVVSGPVSRGRGEAQCQTRIPQHASDTISITRQAGRGSAEPTPTRTM